MSDSGNAVTVFRSADPGRGTQAGLVADRLREAGIEAEISDPGEIVGTCEVRVDEANRARAEEIIAAMPGHLEGDTSPAYDLVTVFTSDGAAAEIEALAVKGILESAGLHVTLMGAPQIPSLPFEVKVPRAEAEIALEAIAAAQAAGPAAAEAAEAEAESFPPPEETGQEQNR
jgi:hypothetical protein